MAKLKKRKRSTEKGFLPAIIIIVVIALVALVGVISFVFGPAESSLAAASSTANNFMSALQANDFSTAYGIISASYQANFTGADVMQSEFTSAGWVPSSFSLAGPQVAPSGKTVVTGTGTFSGATKYFSIFLLKANATWNVVGYMTEDNPPTDEPRT